MPIEFTCPKPDCGEKLTAEDYLAGRKVRCPKCQTYVVVPSPGRRESILSRADRFSFHLACGFLLLFFTAFLAVVLIRCSADPEGSREERATAVAPATQEEPGVSAPTLKEQDQPTETEAVVKPPPAKEAPAKTTTKPKERSKPEPQNMPAPPSEAPIGPAAKPPKEGSAGPTTPTAPKQATAEPPAPAPGGALKQCMEFLKDKDPENRRQAVKVLSQMKDPSAIPLLVWVLKDPDPGVRDEAQAALEKMDPVLVAAAKKRHQLEGPGAPLSLDKDASAYAHMAPLNQLIHKGDFKSTRFQAKLLAPRYPDEIKMKLANLDRIEALRKKCIERVNSGAAKVHMRKICPRYAFAGICKRADENGLTAAIPMPWDKFSKMEVMRFYSEAAEPKCGEDHIAVAAFLVEGGFGQKEHKLALSFLGQAAACGVDATPVRAYVQRLYERQQKFLEKDVHPDLAAKLQKASGESKLLLVYFYAGQQQACLRMDETFQSNSIQEVLALYYHWIKLDVGNFEDHFECCRAYDIEGVPHIIVFDGKARTIASIKGHISVEPLKAFLRSAVLSAKH